MKKGNIPTLISLAYVASWSTALFAWINPLVVNSGFMVWEGGVYLGSLTPLQGTAIILFATTGGLAAMGAAFFVLLKIGDNLNPRIATYWKKQEIPAEDAPAYNPTPCPEQGTHPLELGKSANAIAGYLKAHPLKTGVPLIILGPAMWQAFNIYAKIQAPIIGQLQMFQILTTAIPALSITATTTGALIIANHFYKKKKGNLSKFPA
jgi:hypothetical protein